jgi:hypothetical protein
MSWRAEWSHPNTTWFDDRKTTHPIVADKDQVGNLPAGIAGLRHRGA